MLESKKISFFEDATNFDENFLRGRLRKSILPFLLEHFGKNHHPACNARHRFRFHRCIYADTGQLSHSQSDGWQKLSVVYRTNLQSVYCQF